MTATRKQQLQIELQRLKDDFSKMCAQYVHRNPDVSYAELASRIGIDKAELIRHCHKQGLPARTRGPQPAKID